MRSQLAKVLQEQEEAEEINMTPMLDVVFILLIFFIVTASFVKEAGIEVNRPEAATAVKKERANILVAISDKGEIWINKRRVDVRAVQANIERLKKKLRQSLRYIFPLILATIRLPLMPAEYVKSKLGTANFWRKKGRTN